MLAIDVIERKRLGKPLTDEEITFFWNGYLGGSVSEAQMAALAMAVMFNSLSPSELSCWTQVMIESGTRLSYPVDPARPLVDKHSTGGVGDKVSLVLAPLLASLGFRVPMISGRALGLTGGTLDKLEAIPGFSSALSPERLASQLDAVGCFIASATSDLVPADRRLYALRDTTGTIASVPLIASSIMSKKIASGISHLVLDVKVGQGAFCKTEDMARTLAETMVALGRAHGVTTSARLTGMDTLLGLSAGNACEVREAIDALNGRGPVDLVELTLSLAERLCALAGRPVEAPDLYARLCDGSALLAFENMCAHQGCTSFEPASPEFIREVRATRSLTLGSVLAEPVARASFALGSGRTLPSDDVDPTAGVTFIVQPGSVIRAGDVVAILETTHRESSLEEASALVASSLSEAIPAPYGTFID